LYILVFFNWKMWYGYWKKRSKEDQRIRYSPKEINI
jgi:hypothetical protein